MSDGGRDRASIEVEVISKVNRTAVRRSLDSIVRPSHGFSAVGAIAWLGCLRCEWIIAFRPQRNSPECVACSDAKCDAEPLIRNQPAEALWIGFPRSRRRNDRS